MFTPMYVNKLMNRKKKALPVDQTIRTKFVKKITFLLIRAKERRIVYNGEVSSAELQYIKDLGYTIGYTDKGSRTTLTITWEAEYF